MNEMKRLMWIGTLLGLIVASIFAGGAPSRAQLVDEELRERRIERYEAILRNRPRKGPALRSLYKIHVEALDVDAWLDRVEGQAAAVPDDPRSALLAGLVLQEHGSEQRARPYLERAARLDSRDWYALYCLGESDLFANRYESAVEHLEQAVQRTRETENLVAIYTALGRAYLRLQRPERAENVWDRLIRLRPDDTQTLEELAELLYEEDHIEAAARLFEQLLTRDGLSPYQQVHYAMRLARMKAQIDEPDQALELYRRALERVGPDSWLYDEIHARIERLYREQDRLEALVDLYRERWRSRPGEVELAVRLADQFALQGDATGARRVLEEALERAPSRTDLRQAMVEHCLRAGRFEDAIRHGEELVRAQPQTLEHRLRLAHAWRQRSDAPDHLEQARTWVLSIAEALPESADTAIRVAEALVELNFADAAVEWYRLAVERAPEVHEYHEYLGEHLLQQGRRQAALAAFEALAAGDRRNPASLARLADVLAFHGFEDAALDTLTAAVELEPANFDIGSQYARHLAREGHVEEALAQLDRIEDLAPNVYFRDEIVDQRIRLLGQTDRLQPFYQAQLTGLETEGQGDPEQWILAAKMALGLHKRLEAREWIERAVADRPDDLRILEVAEKIYRTVGDVAGQLRLLQRMAELEPQRRIDLFKRIVATYRRIGDLDQAVEAAQSLIDWVPSSPAGYQLMAQLKSDQGFQDEAFESLRQAIRAAPGEISLRIELAGMFQSQLMIPEAIETYWQVIDVAQEVSEKLAVIKPLSELYHGQGRFDRLVARLRRMKQQARDPLAASLALVAAYETVDDLAAARRELTELAATRPSDENVLRQLVSLSRREGQLDRAIAFQRELTERFPSRTHFRLLGDLLMERNDREAALSAWRRGMDRPAPGGDTDVAQAFEWIEQLERNGFEEEAAAALRELYRRHRSDWRVVYRVAVAHAAADDARSAFTLFREIVELPAPLTADVTADEPDAEAPPWADRFPWPYLAMQEIGAARHAFAGARNRVTGGYPGGQPLDLDRAQSLSLAFITLMEGEPLVDEWIESLRYGSRAERRLLLKIALILHNTEFTRAVSREILSVYPDDAFARFVSMTPSRAQALEGVEDAFLDTVQEHLDWFKAHFPGYAWFYDWHELRVLVMYGDEGRIREVAHRLVERGQADSFVLAQSMNLLHRANLYDIFESCIDGALAYYEQQGAGSVRQRLLNSLGYVAVEILQQDPRELPRALRVFDKYLDATRPASTRAFGRASALAAWGAAGSSITQQIAMPYPQPNAWWENPEQNLLRRFYNTAVQEERDVDLVRHFEHRVDLADGDARIHAQLGLARLYWWSGRPEESRDVLQMAVDEHPHDDSLRIELARLQQEMGHVQDALAQAQQLEPPYGLAYREVQKWLLQLALDAGDEEAARGPADQLSRMRLTPEEMVDLADHLATLGQSDEAQRMMRRAERMQQLAGGFGRGAGFNRAGLEQRMQRLRMHERKGNGEQARLLAQQILRACRRSSPQQADGHRAEALAVLRRLGELDRLVAHAEDRLREQPGSSRWVEDLFWYYRALDREDDAAALLEQEMDRLRDANTFRLRVARLFFDDRAFNASADQLAGILRNDPSIFFGANANYWLLNQAFAEAGRAHELVSAFEQMNSVELVGSRRLLHLNRSQTVAHLINFARDALHQDGVPAELTLQICRLAPDLLSTRQLRETYLPQILDLAGLAYDSTDQPGEAFESFLVCIAPPAVLEEMGLEAALSMRSSSLRNVTWAKEAPNSVLLRCLRAGRKAGRMADLERACRAAASADEAGARFLLFAAVLLQERMAEAMSLAEAAVEDGARVGGRHHQAWTELVHVVAAAQLVREIAPDRALELWEAALASPALDRSAGVEESVVHYFVQTCVQADRKDRARDFLLRDRAPELDGISVTGTADRSELSRVVSSVEHLYELGYSLDALHLARRITEPQLHLQDEQLTRRAEAVLTKIRENRLPALRDTEALNALISRLQGEPIAIESGSGAWESLLWLFQSRGQTNEAAALRAKVREVAGDYGEWRYRLAVASRDAGRDHEAVSDYLAVLRADPARFVSDREEFESAAACFQRSGRMDELIDLLRRTDFRAEIIRLGGGRRPASSEIGNLVQLARQAMHRSVDAPELALVLARRLREAIYGRAAYDVHDQSLAETMERAIRSIDLPPDQRFVEQLELVASTTMMRAIVPERQPVRLRPVWTLGMQWQEREVQGLLTEILDHAETGGRLADLAAAAQQAIDQGEVDKHYLGCLFRLRSDAESVSETQLHQAVAAASAYRDQPERRAYLLCVLAQELVEAGRPEDAVGIYEKAVLLAQQSSHGGTSLSASCYLAATHLACGRPEDAQRVLQAPPVARWSSNRPEHIHDQRSSAMLMQARKLRALDFHAAAWQRAMEVQALYTADPGHRRYRDAESLLASILAQDLPRTRSSGEWDALLAQLRQAREDSPKDARVLHQLYRLHDALGQPEEAARVLNALAGIQPDDPDVHHLLAHVYAGAGQVDRALEQIQALFRLDPVRLIAGPTEQRLLVEMYHQAGRLAELTGTLRGLAGPHLLGAGRQPSEIERVVMGLMAVAEAIQSPPVQRPGEAVGIFEGVWDALPDDSRYDTLETRLQQRLMMVYQELDRPDDLFRTLIQMTAGSAIAQALEIPTRRSSRVDFRLELNWDPDGRPASKIDTLLEVGSRAGRLDDLLGACRSVQTARPLPRHRLLEIMTLLALKRPSEIPLNLPGLAGLLDAMALEAEHRILIQAQLAEAYRAAGDPRTAIYLLRDTLEIARAREPAEDEMHLVFLMADALRADGQDQEAIAAIMEYEPRPTAQAHPEDLAQARLAVLERTVVFLTDLGRPAQALRKTRREVEWASRHAPPTYATQFTDLRRRLIEIELPALRSERPERFAAALVELERTVERGRDDGALEDLYALLLEAGDPDRLRAVEDRLRIQESGNAALLLNMARRAWQVEEVERAARLYEDVLDLDPLLPFVEGTHYRDLVAAAARARRLTVVVDLIDAEFVKSLESAAGRSPSEREQIVRNLLRAAQRLLNADLNEAEAARGLADVAFRACGPDVVETDCRDEAEGHLRRAIAQLPPSDAAFQAFLPWVSTPTMASRFGVQKSPTGPVWTADWRWHETAVRCFLGSFLDLAAATGRDADVLDACLEARDAGESEAVYLAALLRARQAGWDPEAADLAAAARRVAGDPSRPPADRMRMTALLGLELQRIGHLRDAIGCLEDAAAAGRDAKPDPGLTFVLLYLSEAWEHTGDAERAETVLTGWSWPAVNGGNVGGGLADILLQHHYRTAKRLAALGRMEAADERLRRVLAIEDGATRHYYHKKARGLLGGQ